jgi:hypothetical protein
VPDKDTPPNGVSMWDRAKRAWEMRVEGKDIGEIHKETHLFATTGGYTTFFRNKIYMGQQCYGDLVLVDFVEAMVSADDWQKVNAANEERSKKRAGQPMQPDFEPRRVASQYLLSGKVCCGEVDGELHPMHAGVTRNQNGVPWEYYECSRTKASHGERCQCKRIASKAVHEAVIAHLMNDIVTRDNLRPLADHLTSNLTERNADLLAELKVIERELGKIASAIDNLLDQLEETPRADAEPIRKRLAKREEDRRNCEKRAEELRRALTATADIPKITDDTLNTYIQKVHVTLQGEDVALARRLIDKLIARVVLKEKRGTIYYTFPFQELSRIQSIPLTGFEPVFQP